MASHVSIATALDKNRVSSDATYLILLEVDIIDPTSADVVVTLYAANNNDDYVFNGITYSPIPFEITLTQEKEKTPTAQIQVYDLGQIFQAALQAYGGTLGWPARLKVVNTSSPTPQIEIEQNYEIVAAQATDTDYSITFTLGAENPLTLAFPFRKQYQQRCFWAYKDSNCQYSGSMPTCDYTFSQSNGCIAHGNSANYGGFPGLQNLNA
jgi:hypothetical protein